MNSWLRNKITDLYNAVSAPVAATRDALAERLQGVRQTASLLYTRAKEKLGYGETLQDIVEKQAEKDHPEKGKQQEEREKEDINLTPQEHEEAFNGAYKSFRVAGLPKSDIDKYIEQVTPHDKTLIREQLQRLKSTKIQMHMWVMWKKPVECVIELTNEEKKELNDGGKEDCYTRIKKVFNSKMIEIFEGSDLDEILRQIFAFIKTYVEHPALPKSGFTLDHIMHLDIDFHKLVLTRGSSYIELPAWIAKKKAVINPKNDDEECFKWAVIAILHHQEIGKDPQCISKLRPYVVRYNWEGLVFTVALDKIGKFEKNNPEIAVNVLFTGEKSMYIARRSKFNCERSRQVNLLMVVDGENRHYTAIKNTSRLLSALNSKNNKQHYCMNCLNGFHTVEARDKHYEYCIDHDQVKIKMPAEKDKRLQYHDGQNQFRVPFIMYGDFESILVPTVLGNVV